MAALEPAEAALPRRVERGGYSEVDVRKALFKLLAARARRAFTAAFTPLSFHHR
jgi:hypothetical protein